jgi:hypothetical protein
MLICLIRDESIYMKKITLMLIMMIAGQIFLTYSQSTTDYYRSIASGNWHDQSVWESSADSINWTSAAFPPTSIARTITINEGNTVSVFQSVIADEVIVNRGGVLVINSAGPDSIVAFNVADGPMEKDMIVYGKVVATGVPRDSTPFSLNAVGVVSFEDGSFYEHNQNGGAIPISVWQQGSTLLLNAVTDTPPANRAQNYSNIIVDLPNLTFNLNMGFNDNVISGNIHILNTGDLTRFVLVGPQTDEIRTVTILGDIVQSAGNFNSHATGNPNSTAIVHTYGNITVTGGNFSIVRSDQGGSGKTTWYHYADLTLSNAATQNGNPSGARFILSGPEEIKLTLDNVTYGPGGLPIEVDGAVLNLGNSVIGGDGIFILNPGSTIMTSNSGGLDASLQTTGLINLSTEADYIFNGTESQVTGTRLPAAVNSLTVDNPAGVSVSGDVQVNDELKITSGNLLLDARTVTLGNDAELLEIDGRVTGTTGKITTTREINAPSSLNVGGIGLEITSTANFGTTLVERFHYPALINGNNSISRQYRIVPQNNSGLEAKLRLYYHESELDTIQESNLRLYTSADGVSGWEFVNAELDITDNYVETAGVNSFSYFTLAYGDQLVSVETGSGEMPAEYSLNQNYPNPFNPETVIQFDLPEETFVDLSVYNSIGQKVLTLINERMNQGKYSKTFNASDLPSGVYIYKLTSDKATFVKKMVLMK